MTKEKFNLKLCKKCGCLFINYEKPNVCPDCNEERIEGLKSNNRYMNELKKKMENKNV